MTICIYGHPYSSLGTGEQLAAFSRALDTCQVKHKIYDIWGNNNVTTDTVRPWLREKETDDPCYGDVRIFHINGDEIEPCLNNLEKQGFDFYTRKKNIIIPAWELPEFPKVWREAINRFDEIWAMSTYIGKMFSDWAKPVLKYVGQAAERENGVLFPRKYFGIKESSLVFLSFFDQSSFVARKNPLALMTFYKRLRKKHPFGDFQLLLKAKNIDTNSSLKLEKIDENVLIINENLNYYEMTSLLDSSDVFLSLHRAEGFGRGAAEAVLRGRRAIVTAYSGVEDYSADPAVLSVGFDIIPVNRGEYPHHEGQVWAEPQIDAAVEYASTLLIAHEQGLTNAHFFDRNESAGTVVRRVASNASVGMNVLKNLYEIL